MGSYKVIQDISAEDKLIGPLTLKQFIYAGVAAGWLFVGWLIASRTSTWIFGGFFIVALPFIFLASPIGRDQPNDIWLFAKLNYFLRPRKKVWRQAAGGLKVVVKNPTNPTGPPAGDNLSSQEIDNHLKRLAQVLDSQDTTNQLMLNQPNPDVFETQHQANQQQVENRLKDQLNQQAYNAQIKAQAIGQNLINVDPNQALNSYQPAQSAIMKQLAQADELQIATIAGMAQKASTTPSLLVPGNSGPVINPPPTPINYRPVRNYPVYRTSY